MRLLPAPLGTLACALITSVVLTAAPPAHARGGADESAGAQAADCLWQGPAGMVDDPAQNYAFPDAGARYWSAQLTLPTGARLTFDGAYAHARYQSLNSYDMATHAPTDALDDISTRPDPGSSNPYLPGARRAHDAHRSYHVAVLGDPAPSNPAQRAGNTLYAGVAGQTKMALIYRVYLPDRGRDATGGAGLPRPTLHLADGSTVTGPALCQAVEASRNRLPLTTLALQSYLALRDQPGRPTGFPAAARPVWHTFYNPAFSLACVYQGACDGTPARTGGQYSNRDNQYVAGYVSRAFGNVLVLRGRLPVTPATLDREPRMAAHTDLRYWSLCSNESYATTRAAACVDDEHVLTDRHGRYTIVLSLPQDRPANATAANGVTWLSLSPNGDGAGHPDDTMLILRNMLPSTGFHHAVQDTETPGDERAVMGDYLPSGTYTTTTGFEALGHLAAVQAHGSR
ncbi:hypothetical protein OG698_01030 [Streptomyces sp. NBC_01003]|uniref:hypothetical protein n=1 Tax=Streptomyces sp. NBC_01003 TaxID=2903714 RepID=UPI003863831B|nr:hypothetical protein OG698_01030 [Streptomyces sp. NBC_01003]